jgi:ATP-dependent Zn protease
MRRPRDAESEISSTLASNTHVFGFAPDADAFPPAFRIAADGIVRVPPLDLTALSAAVRAVGFRSIPDDLLQTVIGQPLSLLSALIKYGRNPSFVSRSLKRLKHPEYADTPQKVTRKGPNLDDLHGLGDATVWGRELAKDLGEFQAGRLPWADVDRGVLVSGPTGTGKTTFAQALARSCNVPVHIHSLARWQAKGYLNDLLKAMREAFDTARNNAPCILFIDEIDSFGDREMLSGKNEAYEREVINAFLECLDGVEGREGVVVVGATNMPDKIDKAIIRPGRLGKHVKIPLPDATARLGILHHHLGQDVVPGDLTDIAVRLEGASGAVIEQVVRDARRKARSERRPMMPADLHHGLPPRIMQSEQSFLRTCVHEAGHAVVGHLLGIESGSTFVETKVFREIAPDGSGGKTLFHHLPGVDRGKATYLAQLTILLAGIAAEDIVFGNHADGAGGEDDSDLHQATLIAATMEISLGLGNNLIYLSSRRPADVLARVRMDVSLRNQVSKVLEECLQRAKTIIAEQQTPFNEVMSLLKEQGSATAYDLASLTDPGRISLSSHQSMNGPVTVDKGSSR